MMSTVFPGEPTSIFVEAGANVGMSAVYFALRYPGGTIIAVEAGTIKFCDTHEKSRTVSSNHTHHAALWKHEGLVHVQDGGRGHWGMRNIEGKDPTRQAIRATTIQASMQHLRIEQIYLLKIDVEGAESEIFEEPSP